MKKLSLILVCLVLIGTACKKSKSPSPSAPAPTSPTSNMTATETALAGKWYWDKSESYSGGVLTGTYDLSIYPYIGCGPMYMEFKSSLYNGVVNTSTPQMYDNVYSSCAATAPSLSSWIVWVPPTFSQECIQTFLPESGSSIYYFELLTSTNLVLKDWGGTTPQGNKHFYHK